MPEVIASTREAVLQALESLLRHEMPGGLLMPPAPMLLREQDGGDRIPEGGLVVLRDGNPGEPEVLMSPLTYIYEHVAEIDVMVADATPAARQRRFDAICVAIGQALEVDRTLGGLCDWIDARAPEPVAIATEGQDVKAATIGVQITYASPTPLT